MGVYQKNGLLTPTQVFGKRGFLFPPYIPPYLFPQIFLVSSYIFN